MLWFDSAYEENVEQPQRKPRLHRTRAPTSEQLTQLADKIAHRLCRHLARNGWLEGEEDSAFLSERAGGDDSLDALRMSSITNRIATGTQAGRKVVTLQTLPGPKKRRAEARRMSRSTMSARLPSNVPGFLLRIGTCLGIARSRDQFDIACRRFRDSR